MSEHRSQVSIDKTEDFSFSIFLRSILDERIRKNPRYSLRAFARDLQFSPSHLSEIMNRVTNPSRDAMRKICAGIGVSREHTEWICDLHDMKYAKVEWRRQSAQQRLAESSADQSVYLYSEDESRYISGIIHPTILSYLELSSPPKNPEDLAKCIGVPLRDVLSGLARLERIGAIEYCDDGSINVTRTRTRINDGVAPDAIRTFHREYSDFIMTAMAHQPSAQCHFDGIIYSLSSEAVEEFQTILTETRRKLTEVSKKYPKKDAVFYVNLQMVEGKRTWT